jgi:redox-sensitive bicupin YhaK (pirin superfamily)
VFRPGDTVDLVTGNEPCHVMLFGGETMESQRYIWWNFVSSSKDRIEAAKDDWKRARFAIVPGDEEEFIPLPDK